MDPLKLIEKIAAKRAVIEGTEFVAPSTQDRHLILIDGLKKWLTPNVQMGHPLSVWLVEGNNSVFVREASLEEKREFINALPRRTAIAADTYGHVWSKMDCPHNEYDLLNIIGIDVQLFDFVPVGYDGTKFYVADRVKRDRRPQLLRQALTQECKPEYLNIKALTPEMKALYSEIYERVVRSEEDRFKDRINEVMAWAGAELLDIKIPEDGGPVRVRYEIRSVNKTVTTTVDPETLNVLSAGVCLGRDGTDYTLRSLIPIIEHGAKHGLGHWRRRL